MYDYDIDNIFPGWQLEKQLGKGSYGTVYRASKTDTDEVCAIKIIQVPMDASELDSLRFDGLEPNDAREYLSQVVGELVSEIQVMELLRGAENIVRIEEYKVVENQDEISFGIFIRMELLTPFNTYIYGKKLTEDDVIRLGCDILGALTVCAEHNIIHRDIKPENILFNDFGTCKLGDFGVAKKLEHVSVGLSQKGTFNYIAPEVVHSEHYDARADIYSLGIVLYRLMNRNRFPFLDTNKQILNPSERKNAIDLRLRGEALPPPCDASPAMAEVILKACEYDPDMRFSNAEEFLQALISVRDCAYTGGTSNTKIYRKKRGASAKSTKKELSLAAKLKIASAAIILTALGAVLTYVFLTTEKMPGVMGLDLTWAESCLSELGFSSPNVTYTISDTVSEGEVISQDISEGKRISKDKEINLTVSLGEKKPKRIFISYNPNTGGRVIGDSVNTEGLLLTVRYNDGTEEIISEGFTYTPERFMKTGLQTVTISFGGQTTKFGVYVSEGTVMAGGECGIDLKWSFTASGILYISGNGMMTDFENVNPPWSGYMGYITEVILEDGVTSIGDFAFIRAKRLTEFYIPEGVESFGQSALGECDSLKFITVDSNNKYLSSDSFGVLYNKDKTMIYKCPPSAELEGYTIPDTVVSIYGSAFRGTSLTEITIPKNVKNIGDRVFYQCAGLKSVTVLNRDISIDYNAFLDTNPNFVLRALGGSAAEEYANDYGHSFEALYVDPSSCGDSLTWELSDGKLTITGEGDMWSYYDVTDIPWYKKRLMIRSISIGAGVSGISDNVFANCPNLTEITVSADNSSYTSIDGVLYDKRIQTLVRYPEGKSDKYFTVPESVKFIGNYAFSNCALLGNIDFANVTHIGRYAFNQCDRLTSLNIPEGVVSIDRQAFWECDGITEITLPKSLSSLGNQAFAGLSSLLKVTVPKESKYFYTDSDGVLYNRNTTKLILYPPAREGSSYSIPLAVTDIGDSAFHDALYLETVKLHGNIKTIGWSAFLRCKKLNNVDIPDSVTLINSSSFRECDSLTKIIIRGINVTFGDYVFYNSPESFTVYAPGSSTARTYATENAHNFISIGVRK